MAGNDFGTDEEKRIGETRNRTSVSRRSTATDRLDTALDLLADSRRRYLLYYFATVEGDVVELEDAVDAVYRYESAETGTGDRSPRKDVRSALHHDCLPRLSNASILDYDRRQGTIRVTGHDELEEWVEIAHSKERE